MEMLNAFSKTMKDKNWRPKRTLIFLSWDAEEYCIAGMYSCLA